ncbi:GDSL/SGNH-like acyl-esterase family found in Pmr5 and Cas1p-domain-containing protein [Absidia repens]|uniref:GDSL/SGNH-like acyl-esterase family found in Pmr5 and Cas1p-domain-containing protein n=1 Tax=Absidia repens TaxID=90262 RepID=A0A1X2I3V0_9FUNG|nr:GDSL/SGNH-like acyl-esterase family found in Pmr5 and Cas1p-domain-containing protein [Absidia repens]
MPSSTPQLKSSIVYTLSIVSLVMLLVLYWAWRDDLLLLPEPHQTTPDPIASLDFVTHIPSRSLQCTSDTFNTGSWVHRPLQLKEDSIRGMEEAVNYHCRANFPHKCYRRIDDNFKEFNRSLRIVDYTWEPEMCTLIGTDPRKLTAHLATNPLLMVGDSITQLQFESLNCLLGQDLTNVQLDANLTGGDPKVWAGQLVHPSRVQEQGAVSLAYLRSDYLVRLDDFKIMEPFDEEGYLIGKGSNFPWVHALDRFSYIVINTGPHWHADLKWGPNKSDKELVQAFAKGMDAVFKYLKEHVKPHQRIWVRSTPYGHAKCSQYKKPDAVPHAPSKKENEYQWDLLESFDMVWKNWIEAEKDERFRFLNVSSMANLRGDAHSSPDSDCLHTCLPGPVDDWNQLFFHEIAQVAASSISTS